MVAVVSHNVVGGDEGRNISACLPRQVGIDVPIVGQTFGAVYRFVYALRATVVCCNHQVPVAEYLVQVAEVVGSGIRRLDGVASLVDEGVYLQSVLLAGVEHELP